MKTERENRQNCELLQTNAHLINSDLGKDLLLQDKHQTKTEQEVLLG